MECAKKLKQWRNKAAAELVPSDAPVCNMRAQKKEATAKEATRAWPTSKGTKGENAAVRSHEVTSVIQQEDAKGGSVCSETESGRQKVERKKKNAASGEQSATGNVRYGCRYR